MAGRPRQFDSDEVLEAILQVFWEKGYEAASMVELTQATGLHKGSLYKAFGDKHQMFVQSVKRYLERMRAMRSEQLQSSDSPLEGIKAVVHGMIDMASDEYPCAKGCLAVNTIVESAPHDDEIRSVLFEHYQLIHTEVTERVVAGQRVGEISDHYPAPLVTTLLMVFMTGLAASIKGPLDSEQAHELIDRQLDLLVSRP